MGRFFRLISFSLIAFVLILFLLVRVFGVFRMPFISVDAYEVIPPNSALIWEIKDWHGLNQKLSNQAYSEALSDLEMIQKLNRDLVFLDTMFRRSKMDQHVLRVGRIISSAQVSNAGSLDHLTIIDQYPFDLSSQSLESALPDYEFQRSRFKGKTVLSLTSPEGEKMTLCFLKGCLLAGRYAFLVETGIQQASQPANAISRASAFKQMKPLAGFQGDAALYLQISQIPLFSSALIHNTQVEKTEPVQDFGSWIALDLFLKEEGLLFEGYTLTKEGTRAEKLVGQEHKPGNPMSEVLPDHCGFVYTLRSNRLRTLLNTEDISIDPAIEEYILPWLGDELAFVQLDPLSLEIRQEQMAVLHIRNSELFNELMLDYLQEAGELSVSDHANFRIRQLDAKNILKPLLGDGFNTIQQPYFAQVGEYALFTNSLSALKKALDRILLGQTLDRNYRFQSFNLGETTDGQLWVYLDPAYLYRAYERIAKEAYKPNIGEAFQRLAKFSPISIRWDGFEGKFLTEGRIGFEQSNLKRSSVVWRTSLDAPAQTEPVIVKNHRTGALEIFIQDINNTVYQLDATGKVNWKKSIDGPILSDVVQIDVYRNDKLQYLFNTRDFIHLIDREGDDVKGKGYPKRIPPASNGLLLVDYTGRKEYRIFVASENERIYGYERDGKPLSGWNPKAGVGKVFDPMQHALVDGKDYLMVQNDQGTIQFFARNGSPRTSAVPLNSSFNGSFGTDFSQKPYRIVATDVNGQAFVTNLEGKYFKMDLSVGSGQQVEFMFADVLGDGRKESVVISQYDLAIFEHDQLMVEYAFSTSQDAIFEVSIPGESKAAIGTVSSLNQEIHLLDGDGQLYPDFPLAGTTSFSIADLLNDGRTILVVANGEEVYAYRLRM